MLLITLMPRIISPGVINQVTHAVMYFSDHLHRACEEALKSFKTHCNFTKDTVLPLWRRNLCWLPSSVVLCAVPLQEWSALSFSVRRGGKCNHWSTITIQQTAATCVACVRCSEPVLVFLEFEPVCKETTVAPWGLKRKRETARGHSPTMGTCRCHRISEG